MNNNPYMQGLKFGNSVETTMPQGIGLGIPQVQTKLPTPTIPVTTGLPTNANNNIVAPKGMTYQGQPITNGTDIDIKAQVDAINTKKLTGTENTPIGGFGASMGATPSANSQGGLGFTPQGDQPFKLNVTSPTSDALGSGSTYSDVLAKRQLLEQAYGQAYRDYANYQTAQNVGQLNDLSREQNALYSGDTTDYGLGLAGLVKNQDIIKQAARNVNTQGALLQAQGINNMLGFTQQDIGNQLNIAPQSTGMQTSATGDVYAQVRDPLTGQTRIQSYGNIYNGTFKGSPTGGATGNIGGSADTSLIQPYLSQIEDGTNYINADKVPDNLKNAVMIQAANNGVPFLTSQDVTKVRSLNITQQNLQQMADVSQKILGSGLLGRLAGLTLNEVQKYAQSNPDIASFQTYRDTAINAIQALAGGSGSGFRLNQNEIDTATSNLPQINDNIETAKSKLNLMQGFLNKWKNELLPNQQSNPNPTSSNQPSAKGGVTGNPTVGWF